MDGYGLTLDIPAEIENLQLPDSCLLNFYKLKRERIFYIDFEIDISILDIQREIILINLEDRDIPIEEREPIKILIDCPGGLLSETMSLVTTFQMSKTPIWTINMADSYSGGLILLIGGHKRYAMPCSKALIHTGQGGFSGTYEQTQAQAKKYEKEVKVMGDFIIKNTKIDEKLYKKRKAEDWYLNDEEQLKYGIVDEIVDNLFDLL